ncbi:MAG TPA: hypothetical protein VFR58_06525, partial [Flavisolibacter sp.]|nr:hypothetical protein [Flavisolibacter sp.]
MSLKKLLSFFMAALLLALSPTLCHSQQESDASAALDKVLSSPEEIFGALSKRSGEIRAGLNKATRRYLSKLEKSEQKLYRKLYKKDSLKAKQLFEGMDAHYAALRKAPSGALPSSSLYSSRLDSLTTSLSFLKDNPLLKDNASLARTLEGYGQLQQSLNASEQVRKQVAARTRQLKEQLSSLDMVKELKSLQKQAYYYSAQLKEYKSLWEDPSKLEAKLLEAVQRLPQFKSFFAKHSQLGSLFALPGGGDVSPASLAGLQTRASVSQALQDRFGNSSAVRAALQQNLQAAQGQLSALKQKAQSLSQGSLGSASEGELPSFKPNGQKTKSFLKRLEYGLNIQSKRARFMFPVTSELGAQLGYKLNDKSALGIGLSYRLGWGRSWDRISVSHEGIGLRSYLDWKLKGSLYLSGGYEQNYQSRFNRISQLKGLSNWQQSGLVGLSKRYKAGKKVMGEVKLLWDFLSYQQVPRTQALLFRI